MKDRDRSLSLALAGLVFAAILLAVALVSAGPFLLPAVLAVVAAVSATFLTVIAIVVPALHAIGGCQNEGSLGARPREVWSCLNPRGDCPESKERRSRNRDGQVTRKV